MSAVDEGIVREYFELNGFSCVPAAQVHRASAAEDR